MRRRILDLLKRLVPDYPIATRIWRGPFRGAVIILNRRTSTRKIVGLYEHELNAWLEKVVWKVNLVLDVGACDGYFTFGCAAAWLRHKISGEIFSFEPQPEMFSYLRASQLLRQAPGVNIRLISKFVGKRRGPSEIDLDGLDLKKKCNALIKIDVEGAEVEVLEGGKSWINDSNFFLIEVHSEQLGRDVLRVFNKMGVKLRRIDQSPLRLLGREFRKVENFWLVTDLTAPATARDLGLPVADDIVEAAGEPADRFYRTGRRRLVEGRVSRSRS